MLIRLVDTWGGYAMHGLEAFQDRLDAHQIGGHLGGQWERQELVVGP